VIGRETLALHGEDCLKTCARAGVEWPCALDLERSDKDVPGEKAVDFSTDEESLSAMFEEIDRQNGGRAKTEAIVTFTGQVRAREEYEIANTTHGTYGIGYGDVGAFAAQLVMRFASKIEVVPPMREEGLKQVQPLTVCEVMQNLKTLNGIPVAIIGVWSSGLETSDLIEDGCDTRIATGSHVWPNAIALPWAGQLAPTPAPHLGLDQDATREKLAYLRQHSPLTAYQNPWEQVHRQKFAVIYGRLETRQRFVEVTTPSGIKGNGFAHLSHAPAQLLIKGDPSIEVLEEATPADSESHR